MFNSYFLIIASLFIVGCSSNNIKRKVSSEESQYECRGRTVTIENSLNYVDTNQDLYFPLENPTDIRRGFGEKGVFSGRTRLRPYVIYRIELGTKVRAIMSGTVKRAGFFNSSRDNHVLIESDDGIIIRYSGLHRKNLPKRGTRIEAGEAIGKVGFIRLLKVEMFKGNGNGVNGLVKLRSKNCFERREDLLNPTDLLEKLRNSFFETIEV